MKTLEFIKLNESGANNVVASLQQLLADFQVYYTNLRGFHWNIKGHNFFVLHSQFEKMYDDTAEKVDEIAERILMLGGTPANKFSDYLKVANAVSYTHLPQASPSTYSSTILSLPFLSIHYALSILLLFLPIHSSHEIIAKPKISH